VPGGHIVSNAAMSANRSGSNATIRRRIFQRDHGICALCGVDCDVLGQALDAEWQRVKQAHTPREQLERAEFRKRYRWFFRRTSCWDADHIVPVVEGGDAALENIRTLCVPCHQRVTKELVKRRASHRRRERRVRRGTIFDLFC
jgi:5-methylcytosine-specific restriction endonuclease McrA